MSTVKNYMLGTSFNKSLHTQLLVVHNGSLRRASITESCGALHKLKRAAFRNHSALSRLAFEVRHAHCQITVFSKTRSSGQYVYA